ncbi:MULTISPECIES: ScbA/BarX family gamma-butyrolactone biosynthesis protein [unclassified Streptomyces]|uniref:ScbA/BarX family gamma-butyrolactone biosynthesis protein n=1 Tax=unclassified Streptomyces TaxID=2593676 RepID=UPI0009A0CCA4|nr:MULTISPECIES: ScbA/BarX family gamma-butyrolactone biosynthesis protein [unclassified Streptomyces]
MSISGNHGLSYAATVSRQLVHRAAVCEVFLTDTRRRSDNDFLIAAQLPRVHSYYSDHLATPAAYDPLLLLEVFRQTSILVAHEHLGVPLGAKFSFNTGEFTVLDTAALEIGPLPGHALLTASVTADKRRGDERVGVTLQMRLDVDDRAAAVMTMAIQWMPGEAWDQLRARGRAGLDLETPRALAHPGGHRLSPAAVGRRSPANVVLADAASIGRGIVARVVVDQAHPALFDHPLDHIPGALFFEAYRQTALHAAHELLGLSPERLTLTRCDASFARFGEFELPTVCRADLVDDPETPGAAVFRMESLQEETVISTAEIALRCTSPMGRILVPAASAPAKAPACA